MNAGVSAKLGEGWEEAVAGCSVGGLGRDGLV